MTATVLGAGVMGAQIAAHFANAGLRVLLLDVTRDAAREGLQRATRLKPDPFFTPDAAGLVRTGGFDEDLAAARDADWIVEAVVEQLDAKQRADGARRSGPARRRGRQLEHLRHSDRVNRRRPIRGLPPSLARARTSSTRRATCTCSS